MEPEICPKMLKKFIKKISCDSMVKIAGLNVFSECFELEVSSVEGQSREQKGKKRRQWKGLHIKKPKGRRSLSCPKAISCCHVINSFLRRMELIWPTSTLKMSKMSQKCD